MQPEETSTIHSLIFNRMPKSKVILWLWNFLDSSSFVRSRASSSPLIYTLLLSISWFKCWYYLESGWHSNEVYDASESILQNNCLRELFLERTHFFRNIKKGIFNYWKINSVIENEVLLFQKIVFEKLFYKSIRDSIVVTINITTLVACYFGYTNSFLD